MIFLHHSKTLRSPNAHLFIRFLLHLLLKHDSKLLQVFQRFFECRIMHHTLQQLQRDRRFHPSLRNLPPILREKNALQRRRSHSPKKLLHKMAAFKRNIRPIPQREEPRGIFASKRHAHAQNQPNARIAQLLRLQRLQHRIAVQMLLAEHAVEQLITRELDFVLRLQSALIQVFQLRLAPIELVHVVLLPKPLSNLRCRAQNARVPHTLPPWNRRECAAPIRQL